MVSKVILHIGLHHTGTTSFQRFLNDHAVDLKRQGIFVYRPLNNGINGAELRPAAQLAHGSTQSDDVRRNIHRQCSEDGAQALIVSAESLSTLKTQNEVRRLRSLFPSNVSSFKVLIVLRRDESGTRKHWDIPDDQEVDINVMRSIWAKVIDRYRSVFEDVEVLHYQKAGMIEILCNSCGIDVAGLKLDYSYHRTTGLKHFIAREFPGVLNFYTRYLAHSVLGRVKRKLFNE